VGIANIVLFPKILLTHISVVTVTITAIIYRLMTNADVGGRMNHPCPKCFSKKSNKIYGNLVHNKNKPKYQYYRCNKCWAIFIHDEVKDWREINNE
jgi:hypothetical protein